MSTYRRERTVDVGEERLFEYLADVGNLPDYFAGLTSAEPAAGDTVHVTGEVDGRTEEGEAWFHVDRTARRIEWGSAGPNDYHGKLDVTADQDRTHIALELHTSRVDTDEIDAGLDATLDNIQRLLETRHDSAAGRG